MDTTFALQALSLKYVNDNYKNIGVKVENVPYDLDEQVARYKLESLGISIDSLTPAQVEYLDSWNLND
ncbi:S-adenosyl-L-homocysteine hydrolase [compost metagenome]